jgi:hypothetical protein
MDNTTQNSNDSVVVLFKGGRLPAWHRVARSDQKEYEKIHVELMLEVIRNYDLMGIQGYKLLGPQKSWEKFWVIEFPTSDGASEWIKAEMAPPYGSYGNYEYHLARRSNQQNFPQLVTHPRKILKTENTVDPNNLPDIGEDKNSVVVLMFSMLLPEHSYTTAKDRKDREHSDLSSDTARTQKLISFEEFHLVSPQTDWHKVSVAELPTLETAESWIDNQTAPPYGSYFRKTILLARRWAPEFFSTWGNIK